MDKCREGFAVFCMEHKVTDSPFYWKLWQAAWNARQPEVVSPVSETTLGATTLATWAAEQGFKTWAMDHVSVLANLSNWLAARYEKATAEVPGVVSRDLMEELAADEHDRWAGQARTALDEMTPERRERWDRLSKTHYSDLTEEMKELDRMQVRERLAIMTKYLAPAAEVPVPTAVLSLLNQIQNLTFDDDYRTTMNLISDHAAEAMDLLTKGRGGV